MKNEEIFIFESVMKKAIIKKNKQSVTNDLNANMLYIAELENFDSKAVDE